MLAQLQKPGPQKMDWEISAYNQIVPPLVNALKSITGMTFKSATDYQKWWKDAVDKFQVQD